MQLQERLQGQSYWRDRLIDSSPAGGVDCYWLSPRAGEAKTGTIQMRVSDLDREAIASIEYEGRLYRDHGDQRWFPLMFGRGDLEITEQPNGDYVGEKLHIRMRPNGKSLSSSDKSASPLVASLGAHQ